MNSTAILLFRQLLELSSFHARLANKAFKQNAMTVGNTQSGKSAAFYNSAFVVAERFGFDGRAEHMKWAIEKDGAAK